jgi:hypothetical protein
MDEKTTTKKLFLIRHVPSDTYWKPDRCGYTSQVVCAGVYSKEEAEGIVRCRPQEDKMLDLEAELASLKMTRTVVLTASIVVLNEVAG